jgi:hypothetical protein
MTTIQPITGPAVWKGPDIADPTWIHWLDDAAVAEIDAALAQVQERGLSIPFGKDDFPLPGLVGFLEGIPRALDRGPGFALVRGLPRENYTDEQCELIYWGIGMHLGTPISQNSRGHLLGHVRDEGKTFDDPNARAYQTRAKLDFHADQLPVDILGLFCVRTAKSGGASTLVSAHTIHNVLLEERPDLLEVLYQNFTLDWRGEQPPGEDGWYLSPMFSEAGGLVTSRFTSRAYFKSVTRYDPSFALTPEQSEALDFVQELANRDDLRLAMDFQPGDMQFLNNHVLLHAREEYQDYDEPERKRHLLRMWIAYPPERRRPLSPLLAERYRVVEAGGIPVRA